MSSDKKAKDVWRCSKCKTLNSEDTGTCVLCYNRNTPGNLMLACVANRKSWFCTDCCATNFEKKPQFCHHCGACNL